MKKRILLFVTFLLIFTLTACSANTAETTAVVNEAQVLNVASTETTATPSESQSATEVVAENSALHEDAQDYVWDASAVIPILLNGDSISAEGQGVTVDGSTATITAAGTYSLTGTLSDGKIVVNSADAGTVRLILNGASIYNSTSSPIYVQNAEKTIIVLADQTENSVSDGTSYVFESADEDEPNAAIFSKSDLTIYGNGTLTVNGNYNDGIASKDGLILSGGTVLVNAVDDGIRGKDYLVVKDGNITVTAQGDGLKSDNEEDATRGFIYVEKGTLDVTSGGDAIQAATDVVVTDGEIRLTSGGGSNHAISADASAKGIKGTASVSLNGGTFIIDSADDALHSNGSLVINGGTFTLSSGDDGIHSESTLDINAGDIQITQSYEGIESAVISIRDGNIHIVASDDGVNAVSANGGSGGNPGAGPGGGRPIPGDGQGQAPGQGQDTAMDPGQAQNAAGAPGQDAFAGGPGQGGFAGGGNNALYIYGGYMVIEAGGDGMDINGAIEMTGGVVIVNGPTESMNGAIDYNNGFNMTGGFLLAAGSSNMAQAPDESSSQYALLINFDSMLPAGTLVHIENSEGEDIFTFSPSKQYQSIAFSSPELENGVTYEVFYGGEASGTVTDGLYQDATYSAGTQYTSFTISDVVTRIGNNAGFGGRRRP